MRYSAAIYQPELLLSETLPQAPTPPPIHRRYRETISRLHILYITASLPPGPDKYDPRYLRLIQALALKILFRRGLNDLIPIRNADVLDKSALYRSYVLRTSSARISSIHLAHRLSAA